MTILVRREGTFETLQTKEQTTETDSHCLKLAGHSPNDAIFLDYWKSYFHLFIGKMQLDNRTQILLY